AARRQLHGFHPGVAAAIAVGDGVDRRLPGDIEAEVLFVSGDPDPHDHPADQNIFVLVHCESPQSGESSFIAARTLASTSSLRCCIWTIPAVVRSNSTTIGNARGWCATK